MITRLVAMALLPLFESAEYVPQAFRRESVSAGGFGRVALRRVAHVATLIGSAAGNDRFRWVHILVANVPTMVRTAAQRAALTQILDTASDLNRWRLRAHRVEEPQRGSELGVDDQ